MNDGTSVGSGIGVEVECVADRRVPPEGSGRPKPGMKGEEGVDGIG